jgi:hypothetical protein
MGIVVAQAMLVGARGRRAKAEAQTGDDTERGETPNHTCLHRITSPWNARQGTPRQATREVAGRSTKHRCSACQSGGRSYGRPNDLSPYGQGPPTKGRTGNPSTTRRMRIAGDHGDSCRSGHAHWRPRSSRQGRGPNRRRYRARRNPEPHVSSSNYLPMECSPSYAAFPKHEGRHPGNPMGAVSMTSPSRS